MYLIPIALLLSFLSGCIARPFIFKENPDRRIPHLNKGRLLKYSYNDRKVHAYLARRGRRLVVFYHGQKATMIKEQKFARIFHRYGFSVLLQEYPGYGRSYGESASEKKVYADAEQMLKHVFQKYKYKPENTIVWGRSLGSGVATEMLRRNLAQKAILVTPYTSIACVVENKSVPVLPHFLIWDNFNTKSKAKSINKPVLLIAAGKDHLTPPEMAEELRSAFPNAKLITLKKSGHNQVYRYLNRAHWRRILRFAQQ